MAKRSNSATCLDQFRTMVGNCRRQVAQHVSPAEARDAHIPAIDPSLIFSPSQLLFWRIKEALLPTLHGRTKSNYPTEEVALLGNEMSSLLDYAAPLTGEPFHKAAKEAWRKFVTPLQTYSKPVADKIEDDNKRLGAFLAVVADIRSYQKKPIAAKQGKGVSHSEYIGFAKHNEVQIPDDTHIVLFGKKFRITAEQVWNFLDKCIECHYADKKFPVKQADLNRLKGKRLGELRRYIKQETIEEAGRKRIGNQRYTGFGTFCPPAS